MLARPLDVGLIHPREQSIHLRQGLIETMVRIGRSGWDLGTKSSRRRMVNKLSVKVSAPRMRRRKVNCVEFSSQRFDISMR